MAITANHALALLLNGAISRVQYCTILETALGASRRVIAARNGTVFRNCALTGAFTVNGQGAITNIGITSGTTVSLAANLSTGSSTLRIEGNGNWIMGTLGLSGSGCDFIISTNPTTTNGFAFTTIAITPPAALPITADDSIDIMSIQLGAPGAMQTLAIAEQLYAGMSVDTASTQKRWVTEPITVPAWTRDTSGVESLVPGQVVTLRAMPGLDSNGRADIWFFADPVHDAAGSFDTGQAPKTSSNRLFGKIEMAVTLNGVAQTLWDGTTTYTCNIQRATSMRWQSAGVPWNVTTSHINSLIAAGKVMKHKSQGLLHNLSPIDSYPEQLAYKPFKTFGNRNQNAEVGDVLRGAAQGGERDSVGFCHEAFARMVAEVGTHSNEAYATANRVTTLKNLAESVAQLCIAGGVLDSGGRLIDPGGDPNGPFVFHNPDISATFVGKLMPFAGLDGTANASNGTWDVSHLPNLVSYYAFNVCNDPFHLFQVQAMAVAAIGATTNSGIRRGIDGRTNIIISDEDRGHWWGIKALVEAIAITPSGTMPKPFRDKAFFQAALTNTLNSIRTRIVGKRTTYAEKICDDWGCLVTHETTFLENGNRYKAIHNLSADYGNMVVCHIRRLGITEADDIAIWHARNLMRRLTAGGNYYDTPVIYAGNNMGPGVIDNVSIVVGPEFGTDLPYTDMAGYRAWYPEPGKHTGTVTYDEWYTAKSGNDVGNYTFLTMGSANCYKHMVAQGWITNEQIAFDAAAEETALIARLGGPIGAPVNPPKIYTKNTFAF